MDPEDHGMIIAGEKATERAIVHARDLRQMLADDNRAHRARGDADHGRTLLSVRDMPDHGRGRHDGTDITMKAGNGAYLEREATVLPKGIEPIDI
jgi:hypothetical protein